MTETSPRRHRDKTETSPNTETSPKPDRDKTETSPRQDRDMTETSPRQDRDILGEFFSGAWAAPGRLIHVRPQAYRYWGTRQKHSSAPLEAPNMPKHGDTSSKGPCVSRHCHPEFLMQTGTNCGFFNVVIIRLLRIRD